MPIKPLTHLRPLLRTTPIPEHFSSNPSLLHHLPQSGSGSATGSGGSSLVTNASGSASTSAGNSSRAGTSGGGSGSGAGAGGGGGGYTGHARAFLSLPQTTNGDSTTVITSGDDATSERRRSLLLRQRLGQNTRLIGPNDPARAARRQIVAREGSRRLGLVELDSRERLAITQDESSGEGSRQRRSSIAFPTQLASVEPIPRRLSPIPTRSPVSRQPLSRSKTAIDLWRVGLSSPRPGVRSLSTRSRTKPLPDVSEYVPVLQDLAGLDLPTRSIRGVRRNSTVASARIEDEDVPEAATVEDDIPEEDSPSSGRQNDTKINRAIKLAADEGDHDSVRSLIQHYRHPRSLSPFSENRTPGDPQLAKLLPLPEGYTIFTYNACLGALLQIRQPGESIAQILEIYNEMLERDVIPDGRTYSHVITALALRQADVSGAVHAYEEDQKWAAWSAEKLGTSTQHSTGSEMNEVIEGYKAEGNFASALKLFRAAALLRNSKPGDRSPLTAFTVYRDMFNALSSMAEPISEEVIELFDQSKRKDDLKTYRLFYQYVLTALGRAKDLDRVEAIWADFERTRKEGDGSKLEDWVYSSVTGSDTRLDRDVSRFNRSVVHAYIGALIHCGQSEKAMTLVDTIVTTPPTADYKVTDELPLAPGATPSLFVRLIVSLAQAGEVDLANQWFTRYEALRADFGFSRLNIKSVSSLCDELVLRGRWRDAWAIYRDMFWPKTTPLVPALEGAAETPVKEVTPWKLSRSIAQAPGYEAPSPVRFRRLYTAMIAEATNAEPVEAEEILRMIPDFGALVYGGFRSSNGLLEAHLQILYRLKRYDDIHKAMGNFGKKSDSYLDGNLPIDILAADLDFDGLMIALYNVNTRVSLKSSTVSAQVMNRYVKARQSVTTPFDLNIAPEHYAFLFRLILELPEEEVAAGEFDDALVLFMEDLAVLKSMNYDQSDTMTDSFVTLDYGPSIANLLVERFGRDRARHLLAGPFGETRADEVLPALPSQVEEAVSSPTSQTSDSGSMRSPTTSTAPTSPGSEYNFPPTIRIDRAVSGSIDRHTMRNPSITAMNAYEHVLMCLERTQTAPAIDSLGRLMVNIARENDEGKTRELYALGHHIINTTVSPQYQSRNWVILEDSMLMSMCFLGKLEEAGLYRARIVEAGMAPSADAYATMIACSKDTTDDALVARELFDESRAMGVKPNLYLYNTIISKLSRARKAELALELFNHMKAARVRPSSVTYGAVINACCRVGDAESARTLFDEMSSMPNFRPRVPPYNTMMQFHLTTDPSRERVLYYYNKLREHGVAPSAHTYKLLLDAYAVLPHTDLSAMERVFQQLCADRRVPVQGNHWGSIITAYGIYGNDLPRAMAAFDSIPHHPLASIDISHEPVVWEAILNVIANKGTVEDLESVRQRMLASGAKTTAYVHNVLISGYARAGQFDKAREIFESMGDSVVGVAAPNNHPQLLTSSGHFKPSTVTNAPTELVYREPSTYEAMIRAELAAGNRDGAEVVLRRMEERRYPVAVFMRARAILDEQPVTQAPTSFPPWPIPAAAPPQGSTPTYQQNINTINISPYETGIPPLAPGSASESTV